MIKIPGLPLRNLKLLISPTNQRIRDEGFALIFVLFMVLLGIAGGTYLVQQRTNILPFARTISSQSQSGGSTLTASAESCTVPSTQSYCEIEFEWNTDHGGTVELVGGSPYGRTVVEKSGKTKLVFVTLDGRSETEHTTALRGDGNDLVSIKVKAIKEGAEAPNEEDDQETEEEDDAEEEAAEAQNALFQKCGFTKNEAGIPVYAVALGENENINDPECAELIAKQTEYFGDKMEKARLKAEELAKQNGLKYQQGAFVVDEETPDEQKEAAQKKAEELNKTVAPAIKQAEAAQNECDNKSGQEKANCLKNVQEPVQKVMDENQKALAKGALDKLNQILNGERPGGCVKADLNLTPHLEAKRLKARGVDAANPKGRRTFHRLLICAGKNKADWKWRVLVGGNSGADFSNDGEDKGNDAERLYGLYGTDESYNGPPQFGSGFPINRCVTLTGNTPETIRKDLAIYIKAAETGESPKGPDGPCKTAPNKDDTGGNGSERRGGGTTPSGEEDSGDEDESEEEGGGGTTPPGDEGDDTGDEHPGDEAVDDEENTSGTDPKDGKQSNRCDEPDDCRDKGEGFSCVDGSCKYTGPNCKEDGCPEGRVCHSSGQCVRPSTGSGSECPGGVCY